MNNQPKNSVHARRRGALTLELVLIFPILMLLFILFYQLSVMLLTYHSLQTTVTHAAATATTATTVTDITAVIQKGVDKWYYAPENLTQKDSNGTYTFKPADANMWNSSQTLTFRILKKNADGKWQYVAADADLTDASQLMVEIRLPKLESGAIKYNLLSQFEGVSDETNTTPGFTVSALAIRQ
ncbi:MAG: pilus assembly protein [Planctomycetia bacterium]|nr:pilus assembly protein [Planctomycetia bacterium]